MAAFPTQKTPDEAWTELKTLMRMVKAAAQQLRTASASGVTGANAIISYVGNLADHYDQAVALAATPGIGPYAQAQVGGAYDVAVSWEATRLAMIETSSWIRTNFPKGPDNSLAEKKFDLAGRTILNTFTANDLATFRTQLDALIATIN